MHTVTHIFAGPALQLLTIKEGRKRPILDFFVHRNFRLNVLKLVIPFILPLTHPLATLFHYSTLFHAQPHPN